MHTHVRRAVQHLSAMGLGLLMLSSAGSANWVAQAQDSVESAREDRAEARREKAAAAGQLEAAKADDAEVAAALAAVTELVRAQQAEVDEATRQLAVHEADLASALTAQAAANEDYSRLETQLADTAVSGFVAAGDEADLLLETEDVAAALRQESLLDEVNTDTSELIEQLASVQEDRLVLGGRASNAVAASKVIEADLQVVLADLETQLAVQTELKAEMDSRVQKWAAELKNAEAEEAELSRFIRNEEAKRTAPTNVPRPSPTAGNPSAQGFQWPLSARVTSSFGYRVHPIHGTRRLHKGIDLGAGSGSAIAAAKGGTVITAGWLGGYGNTVVVSHGNGLTTLYGHQSKIAVSVGQTVARGELIGYVGSTGQSTGPHLHFEVRSNGTPVNPMPYLP